MRIAKASLILSIMIVLLASSALSVSAIASYNTDGEITGVCYDAATETVIVTVDFTGKHDDDGSGNDKFYVRGTSIFDSKTNTKAVWVPADNNVHTSIVTFNAANADLSQGAEILAGEAMTAQLAGSGVYDPVPACGSEDASTPTFDGIPVPEGYELATITCDTPVYTVDGQVVEDTLVTVGQQWFVDPAATGDWTAIFVASAETVYVPSVCVVP